MEFIAMIIDEIEACKNGVYGVLRDISDIELYALAYKFKIKLIG